MQTEKIKTVAATMTIAGERRASHAHLPGYFHDQESERRLSGESLSPGAPKSESAPGRDQLHQAGSAPAGPGASGGFCGNHAQTVGQRRDRLFPGPASFECRTTSEA